MNEGQEIWYNPDSGVYKIRFDGSPEIQYQILNTLIRNDFKIVEFSVPKAGLLEALYLKFVSESDQANIAAKKDTIEVETII